LWDKDWFQDIGCNTQIGHPKYALVFCGLGYDTHMGSVKCSLVFWLVHANCALENLWSLICNLEIYKFSKLQNCFLAISNLQFFVIYKCALANFNLQFVTM
jgi:hypothetical protein